MKKRLLTWFLLCAMVCSLVPGTVLAVETDELANATPIAIGETVSYSAKVGENKYFSFQVAKDHQFAYVALDQTTTSGGTGGADYYILDAFGDRVSCNVIDYYVDATIPFAGTYYLCIEPSCEESSTFQISGTLTVTLVDNDEQEYNDTESDATLLTSGVSTEIKLLSSDEDWFCIKTEEPHQDIQLNISGFSDDNRGYCDVLFDSRNAYSSVSDRLWSDCTLNFHASYAKTYYFRLRGDSFYTRGVGGKPLSLTVTATVLPPFALSTPVTVSETVSYSIEKNESKYYSFQSTSVGQFVDVSLSSSNSSYTYSQIYDTSGKNYSSVLPSAGTYYIEIRNNSSADSGTFTVTLYDNDEYEPNNSEETATPLTSGQSVDIKLWGNDTDWFCIETTKDAQDVRVDISGFAYNNTGCLTVAFDGDIYYGTRNLTSNDSFYFHASKKGKHYISLTGDNYYYGTSYLKPVSLTVKATVLDGDKNEYNDTRETATKLALGTDKTFSLGGWGDEDWFSFAVDAPVNESGDLYTLRFLDLNPDYSDHLLYEVISPSGETVVSKTTVDITHSVIFSCAEQGAYYVRVYTGTGEYGQSITRSDLRIRVSQGGSDPYESNDTWLEAKPIQVGQLTQHVLSSTTDKDWFWFTAPEADMGFQFTTSRSTNVWVFRAADLAEHGVDGDDIINDGYACKLDEAGVYYLCLTTSSSYATEDLRSFTVTLTSPGSEENNDTWDQATPLYESVPQSFDLFGVNDTDWFKITVPEGAAKLHINTTYAYYALYSETDIINNGLNTTPILDRINSYSSSSNNGSASVTPGTYYLKFVHSRRSYSNEPITNQTVSYSLSESDGASISEAMTLAQNTWSAPFTGDTYIALGELQEGDVVRYDWDKESNQGTNNSLEYPYYYYNHVYLLDSNGDRVTYGSDSAHNACIIPSDGVYYLRVIGADGTNDNGDHYRNRIRYSVSSPDDTPVTALEGPDTIDLYVGQKQYVDLQLTPTGGYIKGIYSLYSYDNYSVAYYDSYTGYVTAKAEGSATLTFKCTVNDETTLTKTVTVNVKASPEATGLTIGGAPTESLAVGNKVYLTADLTPEGAAADVSWSSSDSSVLYVLPGGKVVAVGEGSATITATAGELSDSVTIQTKAAAPTVSQISSVTLDQYALTLYMGEDPQQLTATVLPEGIDTTVTWTSSYTTVATVSQDGTVTAVGPGVSIITAAAGDHNVSCVVTVQAARVRVTGISFAEQTLQLPLGGSTLLSPTITPSNATTKSLTWVSDDPSIASVSRTGEVTALAVGRVTIRATTLDGGHAAEITIEVTANPQLGDVNGDGYIDAGDAMLCMRSIVGLKPELTEQQLEAGDVNHDGIVDAGDAVKILRYSVGLIDSLE